MPKAKVVLWLCQNRPAGCGGLGGTEAPEAEAEGPQTRTRSGVLVRRSHAAPAAMPRSSKARGLQPKQGAAAAVAGVQAVDGVQQPLPAAQDAALCQAQDAPAPLAHKPEAVAQVGSARSKCGALRGAAPTAAAKEAAAAQVS